jgi:hypothetical protein
VRARSVTGCAGPFACCFRAHEPLPNFNYAIPNLPLSSDVRAAPPGLARIDDTASDAGVADRSFSTCRRAVRRRRRRGRAIERGALVVVLTAAGAVRPASTLAWRSGLS